MRLVLVATLLLSACVGWTKTNTALELTFLAEQVIDTRQGEEATRYCAEANPIIGMGGEKMPVVGYMITATIAYTMVAAALPGRWRTAFQGLFVTTQAVNVYQNVSSLAWYHHREAIHDGPIGWHMTNGFCPPY